jgi:hypothetical protein
VNKHAAIEREMFSVGAIPRLYDEDLRQLRNIELMASLESTFEVDLRRSGKKRNWAVQRRLYVCCSYSVTGITTVLKSVGRKRLVENVMD